MGQNSPLFTFSEPRIYRDKENKKWCVRYTLFQGATTSYIREYGTSYNIRLNLIPELETRDLELMKLLKLVIEDLSNGILPFEKKKREEDERLQAIKDAEFFHFDSVLKYTISYRGYDKPRPNQTNSKGTLTNFWKNQLRPYFEQLGKLHDVRLITIDDIETFIDERCKPHTRIDKKGNVRNVKGWSEKTVNVKINYVGMFFYPLIQKRKLSVNPAHKIVRKSEITVNEKGFNLIRFQVFNQLELNILWKLLEDRIYYLAVAKTIYFTFIRPSELIRLRVWMLDLKNNKFILPEWLAKNGACVKKPQEVYIPPALKLILQRYLDETFGNDLKPDYYLFPGHNNGSKRLIPTIQRGVGTLSKIFSFFLGVLREHHPTLFPVNKTLYSLKHTGNTNFIENNYNNKNKSALHILTFLRKQNRHASLNETQKYISEDLGIVLEELENAFVFS